MPPRLVLVRAATVLAVALCCSSAFAKPKAKSAALHPAKTKEADAKAAKGPAYHVKGLSFLTHLRSEPLKEMECESKTCNEGRGTIVVKGATDKNRGDIAIVIREHRDTKGAGAEQLLAMSQKLARKTEEVRVVSGTVGESAAIEQWTVKPTCGGNVTARVLVALPDKVIEIETTAASPGKSAKSQKLVRDMTAILRAIRVKRLGDVVLDPAKDKVPADKVVEAIPTKGC